MKKKGSSPRSNWQATRQVANAAGAGERARHCIRDEVVPRGQPPRPCLQKVKQSEVSFAGCGCGWLTRPGVAPAQGRARPDANAYAHAPRSLPDARDSALLRGRRLRRSVRPLAACACALRDRWQRHRNSKPFGATRHRNSQVVLVQCHQCFSGLFR
jgi:hypothetical protein